MRVKSVGRSALLSLLQSMTQCEVASRAQVKQQAVSKWASGESRPGHFARVALDAAFGIEMGSWDCAPAEDAAPASRAPASMPESIAA